MKTSRIPMGMISLLMLMSALFAAASFAQMRSTKPTARAHLEKVTEMAKAWSSDAALISVNTNQVNEDGSSPAWTYSFYSRRKAKWNLLTAKGRDITNFEVAQGSDKPIKDLFADSDIVLSEAMLKGLKGKNPRMNLSSAGWIVRGGDEPGDAIITINSTSGAFVKRTTVPRN